MCRGTRQLVVTCYCSFSLNNCFEAFDGIGRLQVVCTSEYSIVFLALHYTLLIASSLMGYSRLLENVGGAVILFTL